MGKGFIAAAAIAGAGIAYYLYTRRRKPQPLLEPRHPLLPSLPVLGLGTGGTPTLRHAPTASAMTVRWRSVIAGGGDGASAPFGAGVRNPSPPLSPL